MATLKNLTINDTGYVQLPVGNTGSRPVSPTVGMMRYNNQTNLVEVYTAAGWVSSDDSQVATGGSISTIGGYTIHTFTTTGANTFTPTYTGVVDVLLVAGGGSGAGGIGGGGGAGGMIYNQGVVVTGGSPYTINVGTGGTSSTTSHGPSGNKGADSSAFSITATGGGGGVGYSYTPGTAPGTTDGGSGGGGPGYGGAGGIRPAASGILGQGFPGGYGVHWPGTPAGTHYGGGGGGGAGEIGYARVGNWPTSYQDDGVTTWDPVMKGSASGGSGASSDITGTATYYAGGGAGGNHGPGNAYGWGTCRGGRGGGGNGSWNYGPSYSATYYGGGGGSGSHPAPAPGGIEASGAGYQGIVVVRYKATT